MAFTTYPLNNIQYAAEDAELYNCTRKSGIYANDDFLCTVNGADNIVRIAPGIGWINNSKFAGKVIASKSPDAIDLGAADASLDRIDVVCVRFSTASNKTEFSVKKGTPASSPVIPAISQTASVYELYLCKVYRTAGAVSIKSADVQDLRLDPMYCGLMADSVTTVDTQGINTQVNDLIGRLKSEIKSVHAGSAYLLKSGGAMNGDIDMSTHKIKNLPTPIDSGDAIPKKYFDDRAGRDRIVSQGSIGLWYYRKYASGTAECWCNIYLANNINFTEQAHGWRSEEKFGGTPYPFSIFNPVCNITAQCTNGFVGTIVDCANDPQTTLGETPTFYLTSDADMSGSGGYYYVMYHVIGIYSGEELPDTPIPPDGQSPSGGSTPSGATSSLIDDKSISADTIMHSKPLVDRLCPEFEVRGDIVTCEPVEGYPLHITTAFDPANGSKTSKLTLKRCGANLADLPPAIKSDIRNSYFMSRYIPFNGYATRLAFSCETDDPHNSDRYTLIIVWFADGTHQSSTNSETGKANVVPATMSNIQHKKIESIELRWSNSNNGASHTDTESTYYSFMLSVDPAPYEPYHGDTYTVDFGQEVSGGTYDWTTGALIVDGKQTQLVGSITTALPGVNTVWTDTGTTTVSGREHPMATISRQEKRIAALEAAILKK